MVDVETFMVQLDIEIERKIERPVLDNIKQMVILTFGYILADWPIYTGWSAANHKINLDGSDFAELDPEERPSYKGALTNEIAINYAEQVEKVERLHTPIRKDIFIVIGNAVPYAADISFEEGRGEAIYVAASQLAESQSTFSLGVMI